MSCSSAKRSSGRPRPWSAPVLTLLASENAAGGGNERFPNNNEGGLGTIKFSSAGENAPTDTRGPGTNPGAS